MTMSKQWPWVSRSDTDDRYKSDTTQRGGGQGENLYFKILWKFPNQCLRHFLFSFGHFTHTLHSYSTTSRGKRIEIICFNKYSGSYFTSVSATFTFVTCQWYCTDNRSCRSSLLHLGLWYICFTILFGFLYIVKFQELRWDPSKQGD